MLMVFRYNVPVSILMFLRHPGDHLPELVLDLLAFSVYTPSALVTSYMMMVLLEQIAHNRVLANTGASAAHVVAFTAVFGKPPLSGQNLHHLTCDGA